MPPIRLNDDARILLENYRWPGNVRQLKNITEQISIIEQNREISEEVLKRYLPSISTKNLPALLSKKDEAGFSNEREILYKILFDMKKDMTDLKKLVLNIMEKEEQVISADQEQIIRDLYSSEEIGFSSREQSAQPVPIPHIDKRQIQDTEEVIEESLSLEEKELEMIKKALQKHNGKRKNAAEELGISERTLYRKIKEHNIKG